MSYVLATIGNTQLRSISNKRNTVKSKLPILQQGSSNKNSSILTIPRKAYSNFSKVKRESVSRSNPRPGIRRNLVGHKNSSVPNKINRDQRDFYLKQKVQVSKHSKKR